MGNGGAAAGVSATVNPSSAARSAVAVLAAMALAACDPAPSPSSAPPTDPPTPAPTTLGAERLRGRIAWTVETEAASSDVVTTLLPMAAGDEPHVVAGTNERELDPDVSPDGGSVAYRSNPDPQSDAADIWVVRADGSGATNLTMDPRRNNWSPAWSPDGRRIAFASTRDGGRMSIWVMDEDGRNPTRVTRSHGEYPDWSPDGDRLVYAGSADGTGTGPYDLWVVDADGLTDPARITTWAGGDFAPAWSPDGEWIAYQSDVMGRFELWLVRPDGTGARAITPGEDGVWPAWSPDGLLAWSGPNGVTVVDLDANASLVLDAPKGADFLSWAT
jgi:Tol biopolymer transport system component